MTVRNAVLSVGLGLSAGVLAILTGSWLLAQTVVLTGLAFAIVWRGRHDWWLASAVASGAAVVSVVVSKVVEHLLS